MKIAIEIPKEFEEHFSNDRFQDSLERVCVDVQCGIECSEVQMAGNYELELIKMLREAMLKAEEDIAYTIRRQTKEQRRLKEKVVKE